MSCPTRSIISEPFANQMETIEKAMIEVQNQPLSYYGRRNTATNNNRQATNNMASVPGNHLANANMVPLAQNPHAHHQNQNLAKTANSNAFYQNTKYGYYGQQAHDQQPLDLYGGNFRNTGQLGSRNTPGHQQNPILANQSLLANAQANSGLQNAGMVGMTPHIPQVFNDEKVFSAVPGIMGNPGDSPSLMDAKKQDGLSTFDPFGSEFSGSLFSPMFNSSSKILGSSYNSSSTNIWGNNSKNVAGDAAVWG